MLPTSVMVLATASYNIVGAQCHFIHKHVYYDCALTRVFAWRGKERGWSHAPTTEGLITGEC